MENEKKFSNEMFGYDKREVEEYIKANRRSLSLSDLDGYAEIIDESKTLLSVLPNVVPKPVGNGSISKIPTCLSSLTVIIFRFSKFKFIIFS